MDYEKKETVLNFNQNVDTVDTGTRITISGGKNKIHLNVIKKIYFFLKGKGRSFNTLEYFVMRGNKLLVKGICSPNSCAFYYPDGRNDFLPTIQTEDKVNCQASSWNVTIKNIYLIS